MQKRLPAILFALVIVFLSCAPSTRVANAQEKIKYTFPFGISLAECKVISLEPAWSIGFRRDLNNVCDIDDIDKKIHLYGNLYCEGKEIQEITPEIESKDNLLPALACSGNGNQFCPEAFVVYVYSPPCYQYTIGGRTYYIPRG